MSENPLAGIPKLSATAANFSEADLVRDAACCVDRIVKFERRFHGGNWESAAYKVAKKHRLAHKIFAALRYETRWPKEIAAGAYIKLKAAAAFIDTIEARLENELRLAESEGLNAENSAAVRFAISALSEEAEKAARVEKRGRK